MDAKILGLGYSVPEKVRTNDDPIFDWIKKNTPDGTDLFTGYVDRRVLAPDETLMTVMVPAALSAIADAGLEPGEIDLLLGDASVSHFESPNGLCRLHRELGLREDVWVLPLQNDFSNFNACLMAADAFVRAGRAKHVLICIGGNWTRYVDYHTPQSISASDGAGAAVVGPSDDARLWELRGTETITRSEYYGTMFMGSERVDENCFTRETFHITEAGTKGFQAFGERVPPEAALRLLAKHGVQPCDATLISHQASSVLLDAWNQAIEPGQYIWTIEQFANMTVANVPVTLAWAKENQPVVKNTLVLMSVGPEMHANAVLFTRSPD